MKFLKNPKYLLALLGIVLAGGVAFYVYRMRQKASVPTYQTLAALDAPTGTVASATGTSSTAPAPIPTPSPTTVPSGSVASIAAGEPTAYAPVVAGPIGNVNPAEVADGNVTAPVAASGMESGNAPVYPTYSTEEKEVSGFFNSISN